MAKHCRRVISHHGSDCPTGPHNLRTHRCMILTRIDRPGERSRAWVSGDCAESMPQHARHVWHQTGCPNRYGDDDCSCERSPSERIKRKDHTFDPQLPTWYGGGFWERVTLEPLPPTEEITP